MAKTPLNVRLIDRNNILHPETMVDNLVKTITVADDDTVSTVKFVPVEHREASRGQVYATGGAGAADILIPSSSAPLSNNIVIYDSLGQVLVNTPILSSDNKAAINITYGNSNYGRLGAANTWAGLNTFNNGLNTNVLTVTAASTTYTKLTGLGITFKLAASNSERSISFQDNDGTIAYLSDVTGGDSTTLASAKTYTDTQIAANISSVLKYKGSVKTYADLPKTGNKIGDTWNVEAGYGEAHAGTNWAWNGTTWDPLGGTIDTSVFVKRTELGTGGDLDLTKKLDKQTTTGYFAYTHNGTTQNEIKISNAAEVNTLVSRDSAGEAYGVGMLVTGAMTDTADGSGTTLGTIGFTSSSLGLDALASASDIKRIVLAASNSLQNEHVTLSNSISIETGKKVDKKTTSGNWIYSHTSATQNEIGYGTSATGSTIVQRTPDGGIILPDYDLTTLPPSSAAINHGYVIKLLASYSRITYEEI